MSNSGKENTISIPIEFDKTMDVIRKEVDKLSFKNIPITSPKNGKDIIPVVKKSSGKFKNPKITRILQTHKKKIIIFSVSIVIILVILLTICKNFFQTKPKYHPDEYSPENKNLNKDDFKKKFKLRKFILVFFILSIIIIFFGNIILKKILKKSDT